MLKKIINLIKKLTDKGIYREMTKEEEQELVQKIIKKIREC
jgi:hypothetical protein